MTKIVEIPAEVVTKIQALSVQVESRKEVIAYMLANNFMTDSAQFMKYQTEYSEFYKEFDRAKMDMENAYVRTAVASPKSWNLDYNTREVTITY